MKRIQNLVAADGRVGPVGRGREGRARTPLRAAAGYENLSIPAGCEPPRRATECAPYHHFAAVAAILLSVASSARAHGDLHLRILEVTRRIEAATNNLAPLYLERGELHRAHQDWAAASDDYDRAAKADPRVPALELCRAKLLANRGEYEAARAKFGEAVRRSPADGEGFVGRGRVELKLGQTQAGIADLEKGFQLQSQPQPEDVLELARALAGLGHTDEALRAIDEAIRKVGPVVSLQGYAIDLELERKNWEAALARVETVLTRAPRKETWFARRGDILVKANKPAEARASYEAAMAAIRRLPAPLQQGPPMAQLQAQINRTLAGLTNTPGKNVR